MYIILHLHILIVFHDLCAVPQGVGRQEVSQMLFGDQRGSLRMLYFHQPRNQLFKAFDLLRKKDQQNPDHIFFGVSAKCMFGAV